MRFLTDEDFHGPIVRALVQRAPGLDLVRIQDIGLLSADDPTILAWAASEGRILLTQDRSTMVDFAWERVAEGLPMPGVIAVRDTAALAGIIDDILALAECSREDEWANRVVYVPL